MLRKIVYTGNNSSPPGNRFFYWATSWTSVHHLVSFQLKLEPQLIQVGTNKCFLPTVVTICLHRFETEVNTFPHISQVKYLLFYPFCSNIWQTKLWTKLERVKKKRKNFWLTGEGARDATTSKQNGAAVAQLIAPWAANVRKIGRRYHKIFRSRCPGGIWPPPPPCRPPPRPWSPPTFFLVLTYVK